jgi:cation transport ATPase
VSATLCTHCLLPIRRGGYAHAINGEAHHFCCYGCALAFQVRHGQGDEAEAIGLLIRLGIGGFLAMNTMLFSLLLYAQTLGPDDAALTRAIHWLLLMLTASVLLFLATPFLRQAWNAARAGRLIGDTLVSLGTLAAFGYSAYHVVIGGPGIYFDTVTMVLVVFTLGRYLEAAARARAARNLEPLLAAERAEANVVLDGGDERRPVRELRTGAVIRVRPGERVPVDGVVIEGCSECDEAVLSGESAPQIKHPSDTVYAGSMNGTGQLLIAMTAAGAATRWGEISSQVKQALASPSPLHALSDRAASVFVPLVLALAIGVVWFWSQRVNFDAALMTGLAVLVVACPCALGLAAPLATHLGMARAIERGVLIRNGAVLERLAGVRAFAFDKTGTLTRAAPESIAESIAESIKGETVPEAKPALDALKSRGIPHLVMLSGDKVSAVRRVATVLGITQWRAGLSAQDKVTALHALTEQHGPVAMVGDGLNDGPVLASAAVGIAVGNATGLARETADVVLPINGLRELPRLLTLARRVRATILINIAWASGYNLIALAAAAAGMLQPILASALMAGSSLFVAANSFAMNRRVAEGFNAECAEAQRATNKNAAVL